MDKSDDQSSDLYKPRLHLHQGSRLESIVSNSDSMIVDRCESIGDLDDSQLVGVPVSMVVDRKDCGKNDLMSKIVVEKKNLGVRRRGRPPRGQPKLPPPPPKQKKDEEDVCFICFDGGTLVLCDRRGCPKAYHPSCIKRDEAFFRSKAKWNCGWHICSSCQKASYYMCYTCPFSLCKGCTKDADYQCVRGNKGFCGTCMKTIMLIEKSSPDGELVQVDFDDKSSWEYLFKVYWVYLKEKLSLTVDDLVRAKNPWKGSTVMAQKVALGELHDGTVDGRSSSDNSFRCLKSQRKRPYSQQNFLNKCVSSVDRSSGNKGTQNSLNKCVSSVESIKWATNELLDFVAHMKNGDTTMLSSFDVQALLLEYVKSNNLRDPQQQCQIVCDLRLTNLFGKSHISHFEVLNLLESHIHIKETPSDNVTSVGADEVINPVEGNGKHDTELVDDCERKCKAQKKADGCRQLLNPDEYAAIDVQNIRLIYLRRDLIASLIDDNEKFHDMVLGSIVRIQIPNNDQKDDFYRLVQVVGTSKISTPYKIGEKTTDIMLDILNLDKRESVSIDGISNQEFTEEECRRLRRSIKCGLVKQFSVGEILNKGMVLQALKVNDCLETEILHLNYLHNGASEKGNTNELRECEERLQLLNSSEERQRRLHEILKVCSDPTMDPCYESEEDMNNSNEKRQGSFKRSRNWGFDEKGRELTSSPQGEANSNVTGSDIQQNSADDSEQSINICSSTHANKEGTNLLNDRTRETLESCFGPDNWNVPNSQEVSAATPVTCDGNNQALPEASLSPLSAGIENSSNDAEMERIWQYQDPSGKVQGPFSMMHLRRWSTSGHFSPDLKVWRLTESQYDSILLTNALKACESWHNRHLPSQGQGNELRLGGSDDHYSGQRNGGMNSVQFGSEFIRNVKSEQKHHSALYDTENEPMMSTGSSSPSKDFCAPADATNSNKSHAGNLEVGGDSLKSHNTWSHPSLMDLLSSASLSIKSELSDQMLEVHPAKNKHSPNEDKNSPSITVGETRSQPGCKKQSSSEDCSSQSSGQNWNTANASPHDWNSNCGGVSLVGSMKSSEEIQEIDFFDFPSSTPKPIGDLEIRKPESSCVLVQDSGPSWSSASSLGGVRQFLDLAGEWGGYSRKPAAEGGRDTSLITTSLKSTEVIDDHATAPSTINWQAFVDEPNDFSSLVDESVSDLLAEVEAMECLSGLASSASMVNCSEGLPRDSKSDCFFSIDTFGPIPETGKVDAFRSGSDLQFPYQITVKDEHLTL